MQHVNHTPRPWSPEDISYLKEAYLFSLSLKKMSNHLNRSVSAINKALARNHLRTPGYARPKPRKPLSKHPESTRLHRTPRTYAADSRGLPPDGRLWVSFSYILGWLWGQSINVVRAPKNVYYEWEGRPMSQLTVLYRANLLREERGLPFFWVKGVTWME